MLAIGTALLLAQTGTPQVSDGFLPTGVAVRPAGRSVIVPSRPVDALFSRDGRTVYVKDNGGLRVLDAQSGRETGTLSSPGGASLTGMALNPDGSRLYLSNAGAQLHEIDVLGSKPTLLRSLNLPGPEGKGNSFPCGIAVSADGRFAYVCLSLNNSLAIVNLADGKVQKEVRVGIAPYAVSLSPDGQQAFVSLLGGPFVKAKRTAPSAGTETPIDPRGVASQGGLATVDLASGKLIRAVATARQSSAVLTDGTRTLIAHSNDDQVSVVEASTGRVQKKLNVKPDPRLPFGSMPTALATSKDRLYVALAGNNAVAVLDRTSFRTLGYIPTGWFPTAVAVSGDQLAITSLKGIGSRRRTREVEKGLNSYDYAGTVQLLTEPTEAELAEMTKTVQKELLVPQTLRAYERQVRSKAKPVPVPRKLGDLSLFEHVVYVIKENRTYDQVFGDMKIGDGDPRLCTYPEEVTPNHHAIAREFALLDNYYCNGVLSADGHSWATEANVTPYLERAFGGFSRSYTFGDDPLTYSSTGFLWDRVLDAGLSFRNFGEMDYATLPEGASLRSLLKGRGGPYPLFKHKIGVERLRRYSDPEFPGWNMEIPDVVRMDRFRTEFRRYEKEGGFPNLTVIYLPQDHGGSSVTNRANVADNDLAVGQLVEMLSKSRFWSKTVVFINEDDPQGGFDHIDGHRSICLVASPYTRGMGVVSKFYNQTSVIHTMLRILGLPPLNQRDATSPLMSACFGAKPDLTAYKARPNRIPLDEAELPKASSTFLAYANRVRKQMAKIPRGHKTPADDDLMNHYIWYEAKGFGTPYPTAWAGPHGKGLKRRGLTHVDMGETERDDD